MQSKNILVVMNIKNILAALFTCVASMAFSQNDTIWKRGGIFNASFNQVSLSNWSAGGENAASLNAFANLFANCKKGKIIWDNTLDMGYGITKQGSEKLTKNDDRFEYNTKFGYDALRSKLYYTTLINFRSQFTDGFNYPRTDSSRYISRFAAPAFTLIAFGLDYKPKDYFSVFVSPLTARYIIVNDDSLSKAGAYGVKPGDNLRSEIGAYLNSRFQKEIFTNITLLNKIDLFSNFKENPQNIDINWEILLSLKVNKAITVSIGTQLIYDDNTRILLYKEKNGVKTPDLKSDGTQRSGPRTQFRQIFGIGLAYKLNGYTIQ